MVFREHQETEGHKDPTVLTEPTVQKDKRESKVSVLEERRETAVSRDQWDLKDNAVPKGTRDRRENRTPRSRRDQQVPRVPRDRSDLKERRENLEPVEVE